MVTKKSVVFLMCGMLAVVPGCFEKEQKPEPKPEEKPVVEKEAPQKPEKPQPEKPAPSIGIKEINAPQEFDAILKNGRPTLIFFHSLTCPPCKMMEPIIAELAKKHGEHIDFVSLIASNKSLDDLFTKYNIEAYPTFVFLNSQGKEHKRQVGGASKADFEKGIIEFRDQMVKP